MSNKFWLGLMLAANAVWGLRVAFEGDLSAPILAGLCIALNTVLATVFAYRMGEER
jgi:hypothetical protein